jgi:hypothetical protein
MFRGKLLILLAHAFVGWLFCFGVMGIGMSILPLKKALIVHAVAAPIIFTAVSLSYYSKFNMTKPLLTAFAFTGFVITVDFFLVALVINRSLDMFLSPIGTWIPFLLIFLSVYFTGILKNRRLF